MPFCTIIQYMKRHLSFVFLVIFLCAFFIFYEKAQDEHDKYSVLNIDNLNRICIDLNSDLKCADDEYFRLKYVTAYFYKNDELSRASNAFLKELLENKQITFLEPPSPFYKTAKIAFDNKDVAYTMLKEGYARPSGKNVPVRYIFWQNTCEFLKNEALFKQKPPKIKPKNKLVIESKNPDFISGNIALFLINPLKYPYPSSKARTNLAQALIYNINNAKNSIDFALYGIEEQDEILNALIYAKRRGVVIRGVVDSTPKAPDTYRDTYKLRKYFGAKSDNSPFIMHNKFFIFDNQKVLTTSANISLTGSGGYNSNTALLINSKVLAKAYLKEFEQMYLNKFHTDKEKNELINFKLDKNTLLDLYFAPMSDILTPILAQIKNAKSEILVSAFYLTQRDIIKELIEAKNRGVSVSITLDALAAYKFKERIEPLRQSGIKVKVENWGGKNHQKNILIDKCIFITGSANFSKSAAIKNDENMLIIKNCALGGAYRDYYFNLYNSIDDKYLFKYPRAEGFESGNSCCDGIDNDFDLMIDKNDGGCKK